MSFAMEKGVTLGDRKRALHRHLVRHAGVPEALAEGFAAGVLYHGQRPVNDVAGRDAALASALRPLVSALPDVERRDDIFIAASFGGHDWIAATGHYCGTFAAPLFGIPPTGHVAFLRYGEFYRLGADGLVAEIIALWDLIDLMRQAGVDPLPRWPGVPMLVPGPATRDGVDLSGVDPAGGETTRALVEAMIEGLMQYDGRSLASMGQTRFWSETMLWYGPGGIGSNRRLEGFQDFHQRPFLTAFPDRRGGNHRARVGDGAYCATTGWPSIRATHAGPYLGAPTSGRAITMRVMDWWRRDGDRLAENWVFIDIPDLFAQFGRDLFEEMTARAAGRAARE
jgi:predicted ester cyclase